MRILIVISYFVPEIGSAAHAYYDLARSMVELGHEVSVVTSHPRPYNLSEEDRGKRYDSLSTIDGIEVIRVDNDVKRDSMISRGLEHFTLSRKFFKVIKGRKNDFDICLIHLPPLPLYKLGLKLRRTNGIPCVLNFQDFHPQELTDVGLLKNPILIWLMKMMERDACRKADHIVVLTPGGIDYLLAKGADSGRICHIYNGAPDINLDIEPSVFKKDQSIEDKFLVTYAGILSPFQGIDNILDAAKPLQNSGVLFYIIGDGMIKSHIERRVAEERIENVVLFPMQKREMYVSIIRSSDISIVSLDSRMKAPCLPGKARTIMALGTPILALVPESETSRFITDTGCGIVVDPDDTELIVQTVLKMKNDREMLSRLGANGKRFASKELNSKQIAQQFVDVFEHVLSRSDVV